MFGSVPSRWFAALVLITLGACGGGGNESGPSDSLVVTPSKTTVTGPAGQCALGGPVAEVFIHGGDPPYKLFNTFPGGVILNKSEVSQSGESFLVSVAGACMDAIQVAIEDRFGRLFNYSISSVKGPVEPATPASAAGNSR